MTFPPVYRRARANDSSRTQVPAVTELLTWYVPWRPPRFSPLQETRHSHRQEIGCDQRCAVRRAARTRQRLDLVVSPNYLSSTNIQRKNRNPYITQITVTFAIEASVRRLLRLHYGTYNASLEKTLNTAPPSFPVFDSAHFSPTGLPWQAVLTSPRSPPPTIFRRLLTATMYDTRRNGPWSRPSVVDGA